MRMVLPSIAIPARMRSCSRRPCYPRPEGFSPGREEGSGRWGGEDGRARGFAGSEGRGLVWVCGAFWRRWWRPSVVLLFAPARIGLDSALHLRPRSRASSSASTGQALEVLDEAREESRVALRRGEAAGGGGGGCRGMERVRGTFVHDVRVRWAVRGEWLGLRGERRTRSGLHRRGSACEARTAMARERAAEWGVSVAQGTRMAARAASSIGIWARWCLAGAYGAELLELRREAGPHGGDGDGDAWVFGLNRPALERVLLDEARRLCVASWRADASRQRAGLLEEYGSGLLDVLQMPSGGGCSSGLSRLPGELTRGREERRRAGSTDEQELRWGQAA
ncbi:hypothetical protein FB451DRAFT_1506903 [Mycena latifolia]|nr:hypothetical protein FB451DRAFT_1506903 [Mycena latifolia]